jgi:ParB-like chromosome segregation protein Spo0J
LREEGDVSALAASMGRLGQLVPVELRPLPGGYGVPLRYQLVAGFRRVAALALLRRERALARVHAELSDEDAWGLALAQALLTEPLDRAAVAALGQRLAQSGKAPWAEELLDEALVRAPIEPELRERFFEFLGTGASAATAKVPTDDAGRNDEPNPGGEGYLLAPDGSPMSGEPMAAGSRVEARNPEPGETEEAVEVTPEELASDLETRLYELNADLLVAWESWADLPEEGRRAILEQLRWTADLLPRLSEGAEEER